MAERDPPIPAAPASGIDACGGTAQEQRHTLGTAPGQWHAGGAFVEGTLLTRSRMMWFIRLRWLFVAGALAALLVEQALRLAARPPELLLILAALALVNLLWTALARRILETQDADLFAAAGAQEPAAAGSERAALWLANAQVAVDLLLLTVILRYTGGIESPLLVFYLFHMPIASLLLRRRQALLQGAWAVLLFSGLAVGELSGALGPHHPFLPSVITDGEAADMAPPAVASGTPGRFADPALVLAALATLACGVFGTLYFTLNIATCLQERERQLRRANRALRESEQAIRDLERRRSRFMQTAAHQLKSPLAVIQTLAGLVRDGVVPADQTVDICTTIARRCRDGIDQVAELLTLARVHEADPRRHARATADVALIASDLCSRFAPLAEQKRIRLSCRVADGPVPLASVDPTDLADCLANLIDNAIKYTPAAGRVEVGVAAAELDANPGNVIGGLFVRVTVRDTGMGIEADALRAVDGEPGHEAIFEAFRRGSNALAAGIPGTGLGLSIVREVVEQSHGRLRVHSRPGEGSEFSVYFPAQGLPAGDEPQVRSTRASQVVIEPPAAGRRSCEFRVKRSESRTSSRVVHSELATPCLPFAAPSLRRHGWAPISHSEPVPPAWRGGFGRISWAPNPRIEPMPQAEVASHAG